MKKKLRSTATTEEAHNSTSESEDDVQYDITTSIQESGGTENFLQSPTMILYKKNLRNQGDLENYILENLPFYKNNPCIFAGIKGTNDTKEKINEFYRLNKKTSRNKIILYKGSSSKTTATQQVLLNDGHLYLYVDAVMKNKTAKNKIKKVPLDSLRGDNPDKTKRQSGSSTDDCGNKRSGNNNQGKEKTGMKNVDDIGGEKVNVTTGELVEDLEEDTENIDEDDVREVYIDETNVSGSSSKRRRINRKGGSKNCGLYLLYNKRYEVQECVANVLSYARDHGVLMSGVQLKTLLDIQNVEITKERANGIVQLISTCVDVVTNPHYVAPTAKRPIYEYYGANFKLSEIYPTKSIPIPNEILISYKKKKVDRYENNEKEKEPSIEMTNEDPGLCDNEDIHESVEVNVMRFHGGIDMDPIDNKKKGNKEIEQLNKNNSDNNDNNVNVGVGVATKSNVVTCTDAPDEQIINNNISSFDCLKEATNDKSDETFYKDVGSSSTPIKQQDKSFVSTSATPSSPCIGETASSITINTSSRISSQNAASSIDLPEVIKNYELVETSSTPASSASKISTNNQILLANIEDSDRLHSTTHEIINENSPPVQKVILPQLKQKEVTVEQLAADTIRSKNNKRKSFGLRPTTKTKRQQLTVAKSFKRKQVDASIHPDSSDTTNEKKKLSKTEVCAASYQSLTKSFGRIPKKSNTTLRITNSPSGNNKLDN